MMDPTTIFQIVGAVVSLGDVVIKCITRLSALKAQFHNAPIIVTSMIGQLHMVKIAQDQLSPLNSARLSHDLRYRQLSSQIGNALDSFGPILLALCQQLDRYEGVGSDRMTARSRMGFLYCEREMTNLSILLDRQVNALNLLLQAIQCRTWPQQSEMIEREENQSVLRLAQDCSSSLIGLEDVASFISENTAAISTQFEFDDVLRSTLLYQAAERSHLRQAIRGKIIRDRDKTSTSSLAQRPAAFGFKQAFQAMKLPRIALVSSTVDTQRMIRSDIRRDIIAESSDEHARTEEDPVRADLSHSNSGDVDETSLDTETGQQIEPLLNESNSDMPQLLSGFGGWRKALQWRTSNAHGTALYQQEKISDPEEVKVLLLGTSGGGKTTLLNRLLLFSGVERDKRDESRFRTLVWQHALNSVRDVLTAMKELGVGLELADPAQWSLMGLDVDDRDPALDYQSATELATAVSFLRSTQEFQTAVRWITRRGSTYDFHDNGRYYIENINRLAEQAVHSSAVLHEDLLRTRVTTTGIHRETINHQGSRFCVYDFAGARAERKRWTCAFKDTSVILFPVDATGYGKSLREDWDSDRMLDQFIIFESIANSHWFVRTNFVVVFTKMDLLDQYLEEQDVDTFLREWGIIPKTAPRVTLADQYLSHLEEYFKWLVRSDDTRERVRFVRANLVGLDKYNRADCVTDIFNILESSVPSTGVSTPGKETPTPKESWKE